MARASLSYAQPLRGLVALHCALAQTCAWLKYFTQGRVFKLRTGLIQSGGEVRREDIFSFAQLEGKGNLLYEAFFFAFFLTICNLRVS